MAETKSWTRWLPYVGLLVLALWNASLSATITDLQRQVSFLKVDVETAALAAKLSAAAQERR